MFRKAQSRQRNILSKFSPRLEILEDRCVPATRTWDGGALSNNWSNASNWVSNIAPVAGDDLVFPAGNFDKTADNDYTPGTHFRSISVGGGYTLKGNRVFLGEGGVIDNSGTSNAIKNDLDLGNAAARNFQIGSGSTLFLDGVIQGGTGLTKLGAGNLSLRSNNDYTGITSINAGGLFIEKDEALGQGLAGTNIFTGATLVVNDQAIGAIRLDEPLFVQQGGTIRGINDVVIRGDITTLGTINLRHDGGVLEEMKMVGDVIGAGAVTIQSGTGRVRIEDDGMFNTTGNTTVAGFLILKSDGYAILGDLTITSGGLVRYEENSQLTNTSDITILGTGRLELNGFDNVINSLTMTGGSLKTLSNSILESIIDLVTGTLDYYGSLKMNGGITLSSFSSSLPATIESAYLYSNQLSPEIQVNNGPAVNDAELDGAYLIADTYSKSGEGTLFTRSNSTIERVVEIRQGRFRAEK